MSAGPLALLVALGLVLAAPPARAGTPKVCQQLADVFYVLAVYEERGTSKEEQIVWVREKFGSADSPTQQRLLDRAVDYVYAHDASPEAVRRAARAGCTVNDRGQAVLRLEAP